MTIRRFKTLLLPLCAACLLLAGWMVYHTLSGGQLAGCGAGSNCDAVMGSPWAYVFRTIPVSLPAAVVYALLIVCVLFLEDSGSQSGMTTKSYSGEQNSHSREQNSHSGLDPESLNLNRIIWLLLPLFAGSIVGAGIWFGYLQAFVLHAFCPYCTAEHALGCTIAAIILIAAIQYRGAVPPDPQRRSPPKAATYGQKNGVNPGRTPEKTGDLPGKGRGFWPVFRLFGAGLAAAAVFALVQARTLPDAVYDSGWTEAALPTFAEGELPVLGDGRSEPAMTDKRHSGLDPESPCTTLTLLFDFQCIHCRRLHRILPELLEKAGGQYRIQLCPVPLSSACNPYIPASGIDRFAGSCPLTRYALAVWFARPDAYADYWDALLGDGDEHATIVPADAADRALALLGDDFEAALQDPRIEATLRKAEELFGRTSTAGKSSVPRLIAGQRWLVPETDDPDELLSLIREQL